MAGRRGTRSRAWFPGADKSRRGGRIGVGLRRAGRFVECGRRREWADLPAPQKHGLEAALLRVLDDAPETDVRAVAAAFVAVIDRLAAQCPVVVAIDDLQWLDTSSANVLAYAARRLPKGAALLCTTRTEDAVSRLQLPSRDAVRRIRLRPLTVGELRQVLMFRLGASVARPTLLRIHEIAAGNPFFALELAREIGARRRISEFSLPGSLGDLVTSRISRVGEGAEDALLAMASLPDPTIQLVAQAIESTPDRLVDLLGDAEAQAVVAIDGNRVHFTHPVLAHGMYSGAQRADAVKCTGVWPNSSPNPNYAPAISRCPTPPANRTPYKLSTPPPRSRAVEEPPPPPPNCWSWRSGWAATIRIDRSVVRHAISLPVTPDAQVRYWKPW